MDASGRRTAPPPGGLVTDEVPPGFLSALPATARQRLLADAVRINVPAGALVYRDNERPRIIIVIRGLLRVFLSSLDGRQLTVRYVRGGDVAGLALVVGGPGPMSIQAMTSALVAALRVDQLRSLLATDPGVGRACAEELTRQLYRLFDDLSEQAFLTVRQRIVCRLLDLAVPSDGHGLTVRSTHEELAEAVASIREVVTRNLHHLRDDGLIAITGDGIVLLDPIGLVQEIHGLGRATEDDHARPAPQPGPVHR